MRMDEFRNEFKFAAMESGAMYATSYLEQPGVSISAFAQLLKTSFIAHRVQAQPL
jgi:hypothetical protein